MSNNVVFIGAERVGSSALTTLLKKRKNIVAVFTAHPSLKKKIADYTDFSKIKKQYPAIKFHYIKKTSGLALIKALKKYRPQAIFVVSWSQIIPRRILKIPPQGVIGLHYSLLPKRRGGAPLNWAIIDGLKETGITLFYMNEGIDSGDIIARRKFSIRDTDTVDDLLNKIKVIAPRLILNYFDAVLNGSVLRKKQDHRLATQTSRRQPEDSKINFSWSMERIYNFIRALSRPYPCAFIKFDNKKITFTEAKRISKKQLEIKGYIDDV